jgi:AcrR family transcriptional regulator
VPANPRTSNADIVAAARAILEEHGLDAVTMQAVAARVGVRAPSLYKRFEDRSALISAVAVDAFEELGRELARAPRGEGPANDLRRAADAYRAWAHRAPRSYGLLFADLGAGVAATDDARARSAEPVLSIVGDWLGIGSAIQPTRMLVAFVHGFVSMELAGAFRLGGDVDAAWRSGIDAVVGSLERWRPAPG